MYAAPAVTPFARKGRASSACSRLINFPNVSDVRPAIMTYGNSLLMSGFVLTSQCAPAATETRMITSKLPSANIFTNILLCAVPLGRFFPVNHFPPSFHVVSAVVGIVQVVCVLPNIERQNRLRPTGHEWTVLVGRG